VHSSVDSADFGCSEGKDEDKVGKKRRKEKKTRKNEESRNIEKNLFAKGLYVPSFLAGICNSFKN
jgi:hypothetical protein